jgi:hypothetical protein
MDGTARINNSKRPKKTRDYAGMARRTPTHRRQAMSKKITLHVANEEDPLPILSKKDLWWSLQSLVADMKFNAQAMREIMADSKLTIERARQLDGAALVIEAWTNDLNESKT